MCKFFSLVSDGKANPYYFNADLRKKWLKKEIKQDSPDSHTSIADHFGFKGEKEDKLNKYEYNPLTKIFTIDQINTIDDSMVIEKFCKELDFKAVVPELIIKPIIHPFKDFSIKKVTKKDIELLKEWASVRDSVGASVRDSVRDSVGALVGASVGDSVEASVWISVGALSGDSVGVLVWVSIGSSVWVSIGSLVGASVWAYYASFFDIKYKHDFSSCQKLWEKGLVPSFDGETWRLHGAEGKIVWKGKLK